METREITTHTELGRRIMQLKAEKYEQEEALKRSVKEFAYTFSPMTIMKDSIRTLAEDKEVQTDLTKVGLSMGANFLINTLLGRNRSIKGFLSSVLVGKISGSLINNANVNKIISGIGTFFKKKTETEPTQP